MIRKMLISLVALALPVAAVARDRVVREDATLAPDFHGQIAYFGNYTGTTSLPIEGTRTAPCPARERRCGQRTVGGGVKVVLNFAGDRVTGFFLTVGGFTGPNGLAEGALIGRRGEHGCELYQADGTVWHAGACGPQAFRGAISSVPGIPKQARIEFSTVGMFLRDTGWIEELTQSEARRDRRVEWLRQRLSRPQSAETAFRLSVELDSYARHFRGIDPQGLSAPVMSGKRGRNRAWTLQSSYSAGDATGTVLASMLGERVQCIAWDGGDCTPIGEPAPFPVIEQGEDEEGWLSRSAAPIVGSPPRR